MLTIKEILFFYDINEVRGQIYLDLESDVNDERYEF